MSFLKTLLGMALDVAQGRTWRFETAEFTGACVDKNNNVYDKIVPEGTEIMYYQIRYSVFGRGSKLNWYAFPHGETPDPAELAGAMIPIRYDEDDPLFFDAVGKIIPKGSRKPSKSFLSNFQFRIQ